MPGRVHTLGGILARIEGGCPLPPAADGVGGGERSLLEVLRGARQGRVEDFDHLYQLYAGRTYRYFHQRLGDAQAAEDLVGDLFLKLLGAMRGFRLPRDNPERAFGGWLFRIAHNLLSDYVRKAGRSLSLPDPPAEMENPRERAERRLETAELRQALGALTPEQREVLLLRFSAGLTHAQAAAALGKSERAVKALQHRALARLAREMRRELG